MHSVLSIVELLNNIFAFADKQSNANNACVCKQWSKICLATLWRDVDDLSRLFRILSPLKKKTPQTSRPGKYEFTTYPQRNDWKRFETYCQLIRRISFDGEQSLQFSTVLDVVGRNRSRLNIFPNLHTLELLGTPAGLSLTQYSVIFMHENVKCFVVTLPDPTHQRIGYLSSYFDDIARRMPMLTRLELRDNDRMYEMENNMLELIHDLPNLHMIALPPYWLTSRVIEKLSHLSSLAEIDQSNDFKWVETLELEPSLAEGAFPSLHHLAIVTSFSKVTKFLKSPFFPSKLTVLRITSFSWEEPSEVHELSVAVAENCRLLTTFCLSSMVYSAGILEETPMTLDTLRPLLSCSKMTTFEIVLQHRLSLQLEDIEEIASKWPSLDTLKLNDDRDSFPRESQLTLRSLLPFARHCPRLQHLGLLLDASTMDIPAAHELQFFQKLKCLSMGCSPLAEEGPVALFLSRICPIGCRVTACVTNHWGWGEVEEPQSTNSNKWQTVDRLLPPLTALWVEERERTREGTEKVRMLEAELETLRSQLSEHSDGSTSIAML